MHLSRVVRKAACIAGLTAICALNVAAAAIVTTEHAQAQAQTGGQPEPKSLAFVVRYVEKRPGGEFTVTFDNGEVWQQTDRNQKIVLERGEQVVIRRATTGKFTLVSRSGQSTYVKRLH
jgi:TRAP-type C4-dicarboxylate transport system substrate-binding protein